jgi:hypothetical protein
MTITVEFSDIKSDFIYTVGMPAELAAKSDQELIDLARKHAAREFSAKVEFSSPSAFCAAESGEGTRKTIEQSTARVIR